MKNIKDTIRAMVLLPDLLVTLEETQKLPRREVKIILLVWLLTRSRSNVSSEELLEINKGYTAFLIKEIVTKGFLEFQQSGPNAKHFYRLTPKGRRLINTIETHIGRLVSRYAYLDELDMA